MKSNMDGIYVRTTLIYVKAKDFGRLPQIGSTLILDSVSFRVLDATNEDGLYSIELEANKN
jgi:Mg2+/Co2+ transporter CorC